MKVADRYTVFYDARCRLCRRSRDFLERHAPAAGLRFVDVNDRRAMGRWPQIDLEKAQHEVTVLADDGRIASGYPAVIDLLEAALPGLRTIDPVLTAPGVKQVGQLLYHGISQIRYPLGQLLFGSKRKASPGVASMFTTQHAHENPFRSPDLLKGFMAGIVGGVVASWAMNLLPRLIPGLRSAEEPNVGGDTPHDQGGTHERSRHDQYHNGRQQPTVAIAEAISETVFHHHLTERERPLAGAGVHFAFGAVCGGLYGALAEVAPQVTAGRGTLFGALTWVAADEVALPALHLTEAPTKYPLGAHAQSLAVHIVYGVTTEALRGLFRGTQNGHQEARRWR